MIDIAIAKSFANFSLDATFRTDDGITALFGPSGAGKTSVVKAVAGILQPDKGHIKLGQRTLLDTATATNVPVHRRKVGYVFQEPRLFPHMTVAKNLRYGGTYDADRIILMLGLERLLDRMPRHLSGGEAQRVALGRALMCNPDILLMDEPLAALDAARKAEIIPFLLRLRDTTQLPTLYVSHDISEVAKLASHIVMMRDGQVVQSGTATEILSDPTLVSAIGLSDAGSLITAQIDRIDEADELTYLGFDGGQIVLPGTTGHVGQGVRLRVPAQDVILSRARPDGISAINVLGVKILALNAGDGPGVAVQLAAGKTKFLARITKHSAHRLGLQIGDEIYAIIKATAVAATDTDIRSVAL